MGVFKPFGSILPSPLGWGKRERLNSAAQGTTSSHFSPRLPAINQTETPTISALESSLNLGMLVKPKTTSGRTNGRWRREKRSRIIFTSSPHPKHRAISATGSVFDITVRIVSSTGLNTRPATPHGPAPVPQTSRAGEIASTALVTFQGNSLGIRGRLGRI